MRIDATAERKATYQYRVAAFNDVGVSGYSFSEEMQWDPSPEGELIINAEETPDGLLISWSGNILYHDGIRVERSVDEESFEIIVNLPSTASSHLAQLPEKDTRFRIVAYNSRGTITSQEYKLVVTGVSIETPDLQVYPNPADMAFFTHQVDGEWTLVSPIGQRIKVSPASEGGLLKFDTTLFASGVYTLEFSRSQQLVRMRILISH